jgi:hypothetical protein
MSHHEAGCFSDFIAPRRHSRGGLLFFGPYLLGCSTFSPMFQSHQTTSRTPVCIMGVCVYINFSFWQQCPLHPQRPTLSPLPTTEIRPQADILPEDDMRQVYLGVSSPLGKCQQSCSWSTALFTSRLWGTMAQWPWISARSCRAKAASVVGGLSRMWGKCQFWWGCQAAKFSGCISL